MPDFDTRRPQEPNEPNGLRTPPSANKLRSLFANNRLLSLLFVVLLFVVAVVAVLYGCGQASSPAGKQEKQGGVEEAQQEENGKCSSGEAGEQQEEALQEENGKIIFLRSTSDTGSTIYEMNADG